MTTTSKNKRKNKSLCEISTKIAINIVKASSLTIARMTLGSIAPAERSSHSKRAHQMKAEAPASVLPGDNGNKKRLVEPESHLASYLMQPDQGHNVDGRAVDYIIRFREKNLSDASVRAEVSKCIPPPPSRCFS